MERTTSTRSYRVMSPEEKEDWKRTCAIVEAEMPDIVRRRDMALAARQEPSLMGRLRDAVQTSDFSLNKIADETGVTLIELSEFLTGESSLPCPVLDQLAALLGYELTPVPTETTAHTQEIAS